MPIETRIGHCGDTRSRCGPSGEATLALTFPRLCLPLGFSQLCATTPTSFPVTMSNASQKTMRAAMFHGAKDIRIEEQQVPTPKDGQVLVKVAW